MVCPYIPHTKWCVSMFPPIHIKGCVPRSRTEGSTIFEVVPLLVCNDPSCKKLIEEFLVKEWNTAYQLSLYTMHQHVPFQARPPYLKSSQNHQATQCYQLNKKPPIMTYLFFPASEIWCLWHSTWHCYNSHSFNDLHTVCLWGALIFYKFWSRLIHYTPLLLKRFDLSLDLLSTQ